MPLPCDQYTGVTREFLRRNPYMQVQQSQMLVVGPGQGKSIQLGKGMGVDFMVWGHQTGGRFAIVEHPIDPRRRVPPEVHRMEDKLSYVLEGRVGVRIG